MIPKMSSTNALKVSVLASDELLLDGNPITLPELAQAMEQAAKVKAAVWYYRDNAQDHASSLAMEVVRLIKANRLPIRFSTKPDFSDSFPNVGEVFTRIRQKAAQGQVVVLRRDLKYLLFAALEKESASIDNLAAVERMLPSSIK